jgi:hypothetical protein
MRDFVVLPYFFLDSTSRRRDSFCPHPFQFTPSSYCTPSSTYCWHTVITQRTSTRTCTCKNELSAIVWKLSFRLRPRTRKLTFVSNGFLNVDEILIMESISRSLYERQEIHNNKSAYPFQYHCLKPFCILPAVSVVRPCHVTSSLAAGNMKPKSGYVIREIKIAYLLLLKQRSKWNFINRFSVEEIKK